MDFTSHKLELAKNWTWETFDLHAHGGKFIKAPDKQINAIWSSDDSQKERFDQRCAGRPAGPPSRPLCGAHTHNSDPSNPQRSQYRFFKASSNNTECSAFAQAFTSEVELAGMSPPT